MIQSWIFSIITADFSITWSLRNHSNKLICCPKTFLIINDENEMCIDKVQKNSLYEVLSIWLYLYVKKKHTISFNGSVSDWKTTEIKLYLCLLFDKDKVQEMKSWTNHDNPLILGALLMTAQRSSVTGSYSRRSELIQIQRESKLTSWCIWLCPPSEPWSSPGGDDCRTSHSSTAHRGDT